MVITQTIAVPLLAVLTVASIIDLRYRRIPNGLSLGGAVVALIINGALSGSTGLMLSSSGWLLCLLCFLPFYGVGAMAAGDVKLMAMAGTFLGPIDGFVAVLCTLAAGSVIGVLYLFAPSAHQARTSTPSIFSGHNVEEHPIKRLVANQKIPYASAIAIGTLIVVWQPALLLAVFPTGGWK